MTEKRTRVKIGRAVRVAPKPPPEDHPAAATRLMVPESHVGLTIARTMDEALRGRRQ